MFFPQRKLTKTFVVYVAGPCKLILHVHNYIIITAVLQPHDKEVVYIVHGREVTKVLNNSKILFCCICLPLQGSTLYFTTFGYFSFGVNANYKLWPTEIYTL